MDRGWSDIGYHFVIDRDGTLATGRPLARMGAHVKGHNKGTVGVALMGRHSSAVTYFFSDHFTIELGRALRRWIVDLKDQYPAIKTVSGHNVYAVKV